MYKHIAGTYRRLFSSCGFEVFFRKYLWRNSYLLVPVFLGMSVSSFAISKETLENLVDEDRVITQPLELHLTSPDAPMINSTVSLNNVDAWLFFDNIKPSVVIENQVSNIMINGVQLQVGVNGRVSIYAHGTVVIPHPSSFKPLTVFTEDNFGGNSRQLAIHTYHNYLGEFDNAVKSFTLKRGYMATFANNADGSGYSRVFIADNEDIEFSVLPAELYGTISFIRVFKHEWVSKKGWCGWNFDEYQMVNATCYYDWNVGGSTSANTEYIPIRQNGGWPSWTDINAKQNVSHLLGFNEPDRPDQANMTFEEIIDIWPGMMQSGLRIGSPAWSNPWGGNGGNLFDFINKCGELNYRVDFVALHCYWGGKSPINWYNDLKYIYEATGRPLWITEWNNGANWTTEWWPDDTWELTPANAEKQLNDLKGILRVLDTTSFVERYFIYNWVEDRRAMILYDENDLAYLTPAGEYYAANKSQIAYNKSNDVTPGWIYSSPELSMTYLSLSNSIRLSWADGNGELSKEYKLERKLNDGDYQTIYTSDDVSVLSYNDPVDPGMNGTLTYRLSLRTIEGEFLVSNEVSTYQTAGIDSIQFGSFLLNNSEWKTSLFSEKYSDAPLVILGIPTFNNVLPMTQRVNNVTGIRFKFQLDPWDYLNNPDLTKTDILSVLALPAGSYNFGGIKAEAGSLSDIDREWDTVYFTEAFEKLPVVFCTIVTASNIYPLTVAVRNVTKTGFELCLKTEETVTGLVFPEAVNYIAIEPGKGAIEGKRVTVGRCEEGVGISSIPLEIEYDTSYSEPAVFAGMLSSADKFASTLRYYGSGESKIKIMKQRELSGSISKVEEDQLGWMVMDMAEGQIINAIQDEFHDPLVIYPNPVTDVIYFNFDRSTQIEIFDITGRKRLEVNAVNSIDVSVLSAGLYIIKMNGTSSERFIKR